ARGAAQEGGERGLGPRGGGVRARARARGGLNGPRKTNGPTRGPFFHLAERVGFEPTVRLHVRLISSQVHSTTLPPLRWAGNDTGQGRLGQARRHLDKRP